MSARSVPAKNGWRGYYYICYSNNQQRPCRNHSSFNARQVDAAAWYQIREWLMDPDKLLVSLTDYQRQKDELTRPLRDRLQTIAGLAQDNEARIQRINDGYAGGFYTLQEAHEQKHAAQSALGELAEERERLQRMVQDQEMNNDQLGAIRQYARAIGAGIEEADGSFTRRRELVEALETVVQLETIDGQKVLHLHCALGAVDVSIGGATSKRQKRTCRVRPIEEAPCSSGCPGSGDSDPHDDMPRSARRSTSQPSAR